MRPMRLRGWFRARYNLRISDFAEATTLDQLRKLALIRRRCAMLEGLIASTDDARLRYKLARSAWRLQRRHDTFAYVFLQMEQSYPKRTAEFRA